MPAAPWWALWDWSAGATIVWLPLALLGALAFIVRRNR